MISCKKILFLLLFLLPLHGINAQEPKAVTISYEYNELKSGNDTYATNHDYCEYCIVVDFSLTGYKVVPDKQTIILYPGRNFLFLLKNEKFGSSNWYYRYYKGYINANVNADYCYALPVVPGDSVRIEHGGRNGTRFNLRQVSDTVYACRGGIVCNDDFIAKNLKGKQLTIYHKDGTFAQYSALQEILVTSGSKVKTGMPVAIVNTDYKDAHFVELKIYFLDKNKMNDNESGDKYTTLRPFFHTQNHEPERLEENIIYIGEITDEMLMQDMSAKEKKQYLKKKK